MNKLNKLFAILIAVLGVTTLKAQTDVTSLYLTNADFSSTTGWTAYVSNQYKDYGNGKIGGKLASYAASSTDATHLNSEYFFGFQCRWSGNYASYNQETSQALPAGVYTLSYDVENVNGSTSAVNYNNLFYVKVGDKTFTDTSVEWMKGKSSWTSHSITFVITEATKATVSLGYGTGSNNLGSGNTPVLYVSHLKLIHRELDDISSENPADLTSYIVNNSFETGNLNGWTYKGSSDTGVKPNSNNTYKTSGVDGNYLYNTWWQGTPLTQTVGNIPNGIYELKVLLASDQNAKLFLLANDEHSEVYTITTDNKTFHDVSYEFKVLNGQAKIGVVGGNDAGEYVADGHWWYKADNFRLIYKGADLTLEQEALATNLAAARAVDQTNIPTVVASLLNEAINTAENVEQTLGAIRAASSGLVEVLNVVSEIQDPYVRLKKLLDECNGIKTNSEESENGAKSIFGSEITSVESVYNEKQTAADINALYEQLEAARTVYIEKADPTNDTYFDYTYKIKNAAVASSSNWTNYREGSGQQYTGAPDNKYLDSWNGAGQDIYQNLTGLPSGLYTLTAAGRASTSCTSAYIYLNDTEAEIEKAGNEGNDLGNGWKWYTTAKTAVNGTAKIGFKANTADSQWAGADDFKLYYYGFDVATAQNGVTSLKAEAEALVGKPMNATVANKLNEAIAGADATKTTRLELAPMVDALSNAIEDAKASIADYALKKTYIDKANKIDESIAAGYTTQYNNGTISETAETVFQNLEVATYNYVTSNFTYEVALDNKWNSNGINTAAADFNNEHWSGETRSYKNQQDGDNWGWGAQSWSIDFDQEVTLPAGEYVFKVAGRKSEGTTLELVVTMGETVLGTVNDFPNGSTGRGINKAGAASFDPADPAGFTRNEGTGFGWQWRYVRFELNSESTVKVAVHAETNAAHNWVSFGDYTLQMTEETYLAANMGGLAAPMAAAQALVGTKPMGAAEDAALQDAIDMPVTTGAELKAKIDALNTAVANANQWVVAYNNAKAPLVAALERFEADYNGVKMSKSDWENVLDEVQAAAVAKDVTDSYDGFAVAAEELNAALDAAQASINAYAALNEAIMQAETLASANVGDQPFQRSADAINGLGIADAQATYTAATADSEEVTSVTETLKAAINGIVLNAPAEGQRFYIKVATEGHGKLGNALLATLGNTSANNPTGYGLNTDNAAKGYLAQAFIFTQVEGNLYNISIERPEGTVYLTYGLLNGSAAGWNKQQIQATTNAENKGEFKIEATAKEGVLKIFNTIDNNYLDCQDGGSIYTDTGISNEEFAFELASEHEVTLTISAARWATLILPFNAELPEGVKAWSCSGVAEDGVTLILKEAENIVANTPYLVSGAKGTYNFSGYGLADKDSYDDGLFTGTYAEIAAPVGSYVLQKNNDVLGFYLVGDTKPTVKAYRCYMTYKGAGAPMFRIGEDETTSIHNSELSTQDSAVVYDLMGRKVNTLEKGGMYIVNGKKVIVK